MSYIVTVKKSILSSKKYKLFLPKTIIHTFQLQEGMQKYVHFGSKKLLCTIYTSHHGTENDIIFSQKAWECLHIPNPHRLTIQKVRDCLYVGPLIGIITATLSHDKSFTDENRSTLFANYCKTANSLGALVVIFDAQHVDIKRKYISGYIFTKNGWIKSLVPLPNVIYDCLPNRRSEEDATYQKVRNIFIHDYHIPWFNPGFFNKWTIYKRLKTVASVKHFLPKTIHSPTIDELKHFIVQHQNLYIKPVNGSLGIGIKQLIYNKKDDFYYFRSQDGNNGRLRKYGSLYRMLKIQFPTGLQNMIVQEGIPLLRYENNPVDFRIHTNKDKDGRWNITAIAAKIANPNCITTHVIYGGQIKSIQEIWSCLHLNRELLLKLKESALKISRAIEGTTDGIVGELGLDLGIDVDGNIWMFEANAKPGRTIFTHPKLKKDEYVTLIMPIQFCFHLYEKSIQRGLDEGN